LLYKEAASIAPMIAKSQPILCCVRIITAAAISIVTQISKLVFDLLLISESISLKFFGTFFLPLVLQI